MNKISFLRKKISSFWQISLGIVVGISLVTAHAYADSSNFFTGCIQDNGGVFYNVKLGISPKAPCSSGDAQVSADDGDIKSVTPGTGLTGGGTVGDLTLGIATGGVGAGQLANGSVTIDKISNSASESSRILTWSHEDEFVYDADTTNVLDPELTVTVPEGKAYNYAIVVKGVYLYLNSEKVGSNTSFFAAMRGRILSDTTSVGGYQWMLHTGYRQSWSALGDSQYWATPYTGTWFVRLTEGTHNIKPEFTIMSDGTMNKARLKYQDIQMIRIL